MNAPRIVYLIEEQSNPSTDYFLLPALSASDLNIVRCGFTDLPSQDLLDNALVVFVRYVPPAWASLIAKVHHRLNDLVFFMDDDVLDVRASAGMPLRYRFKLAKYAAWKMKWLQRYGAKLWVSTVYLQNKYADWQPTLLLPSPLEKSADVCRVFYHGSASHKAEIHWLYPVMKEVLQADSRVLFEIIGGQNIYQLFRGLPRVSVIHPMKWPAYQAFLTMPGRHIGLAPLLNLPFNQARSYTKFFDITRCGAVGIYSPDSACADVVTDREDGVIVELDPARWAAEILQLANNRSEQQQLAVNAKITMKKLSLTAQDNSLGLLDG